MSQDKVAYLLMAWSISSCIFSFFTGKLADRFSNHRVLIFQFAMIGVATSTSLISVASSFESFIALMVMYGAFDSSFVLLRPVVAEDLVGSNKASRGVGLMFAALGFAYLSGIPLAGRYTSRETEFCQFHNERNVFKWLFLICKNLYRLLYKTSSKISCIQTAFFRRCGVL